jgi:hypothetical protein
MFYFGTMAGSGDCQLLVGQRESLSRAAFQDGNQLERFSARTEQCRQFRITDGRNYSSVGTNHGNSAMMQPFQVTTAGKCY